MERQLLEDRGEGAFGRAVAMRDRAFRFARSLTGDASEAQDVVQDVFERMWTRRAELETVANVEAYVMSAVRNLCLDRIRNRRNREGKHELLRVEMEVVTVIDVDHLDTLSIIHKAMARLPERQREVVHLRDIEGYEIEEIGELIAADPPTVRVLLSRGRQSLRAMLVELGIRN